MGISRSVIAYQDYNGLSRFASVTDGRELGEAFKLYVRGLRNLYDTPVKVSEALAEVFDTLTRFAHFSRVMCIPSDDFRVKDFETVYGLTLPVGPEVRVDGVTYSLVALAVTVSLQGEDEPCYCDAPVCDCFAGYPPEEDLWPVRRTDTPVTEAVRVGDAVSDTNMNTPDRERMYRNFFDAFTGYYCIEDGVSVAYSCFNRFEVNVWQDPDFTSGEHDAALPLDRK